ncbi:MAG: hypothetical protein WKF81_08265 [Thermomicrobiales bacterium]
MSAVRVNVLAQDATPAGDACAAVGGDDAMTSPEASPVAEEAPVGTPVEDQAVIDTATAAISEAWGCVNEFGLMSTFTEVLGVVDYGDGSLGVDYQVATGSKQIERFLDVIEDMDGTWKITDRSLLNPETDSDLSTIGIRFATVDDELVIESNLASFETNEAIEFQVTNTGDWAHNFVLVMVPEGFDPAAAGHFDVLAPAEGTTVEGGISLEAGEVGSAIFEGLEAGSYVIYCVMEAPDGETHADKGMFLALTITERVVIEVPDVVGTPAD